LYSNSDLEIISNGDDAAEGSHGKPDAEVSDQDRQLEVMNGIT
jgi:hypothetical protein